MKGHNNEKFLKRGEECKCDMMNNERQREEGGEVGREAGERKRKITRRITIRRW